GERITALRAGGFQCAEALQSQVTERVYTAAKHRVAQSCVEQPLGTEQCATAGGAGGGNGVARPGQLQPVAKKACRRAERLMPVVIIRRKLTVADQPGDTLRGLLNAGGAGTQYHADTSMAVVL